MYHESQELRPLRVHTEISAVKTVASTLAFGWACTVLLVVAGNRPRQRDQAALAVLQDYIGSWRGVGQPRRGSNRGAWIEQLEWAWSFTDSAASFKFYSPHGKYFREGSLRAGPEPGRFHLTATTAAGSRQVVYQGQLTEDGQLELVAAAAEAELPYQISMRLVADGKRLVVLYQRQTGADQLVRMAEVGYTRHGSNFGKGASFVECIVTGGKATIPVSYEGKTYYVCCSGCRDLFYKDPQAVLREYQQRKGNQ